MRIPTLFLGHGNPMNAIADNAYTRAIAELGRRLGKPKAILCISAHWQQQEVSVTHMASPRTIHDFHGFPEELFRVQYKAPGSPRLAERIAELIPQTQLDESWGFDHGTWSVLVHMYPEADIPVVQLSLDMTKAPQFHFELGKQLRPLRDEGVMIIGSGNLVHNLGHISWKENAPPAPQAVEFNEALKKQIQSGDYAPLFDVLPATPAGKYSVPTWEHYLPALYVLGASTPDERLKIEYDEIQNASIAMLSFSFS